MALKVIHNFDRMVYKLEPLVMELTRRQLGVLCNYPVERLGLSGPIKRITAILDYRYDYPVIVEIGSSSYRVDSRHKLEEIISGLIKRRPDNIYYQESMNSVDGNQE